VPYDIWWNVNIVYIYYVPYNARYSLNWRYVDGGIGDLNATDRLVRCLIFLLAHVHYFVF
jgi:hypothetical protein